MNPEFIKYLEAIGMKSPLIDRVKKFTNFMRRFCQMKLRTYLWRII